MGVKNKYQGNNKVHLSSTVKQKHNQEKLCKSVDVVSLNRVVGYLVTFINIYSSTTCLLPAIRRWPLVASELTMPVEEKVFAHCSQALLILAD